MTPDLLVAIAGGIAYGLACIGLGFVVAPLIEAVSRPRPVGRHRAHP